MKNRIRHVRIQRGMTQADLADRLGTTPATVSRLETNQMTVSTDWLGRIALVLGTHPAELIENPERPAIQMLGAAGRNGRLSGTPESWFLDPPGGDAVAARVTAAQGPYGAGEIVVGERLPANGILNGIGRDCLCETADGTVMLARVVGNPPHFTLVPAAAGAPVLYDTALKWLAPIAYRILRTDGPA